MTPFLTWAAKGRHPPRRRLRRRPVTSPLRRWGGRAGQSHRVNTFPVLGGIRAQPPAHASAPPTPAAACIAKVLFPRRRHPAIFAEPLRTGSRVTQQNEGVLVGRAPTIPENQTLTGGVCALHPSVRVRETYGRFFVILPVERSIAKGVP
ncbi:hypothetical protein Bbelb_112120 [Branchiostoma belcheri]|nr:hypothetical protein Bbelb_112120 [Branchiostoma belcheri]